MAPDPDVARETPFETLLWPAVGIALSLRLVVRVANPPATTPWTNEALSRDGYTGISEFLNRDPDLLVFRRFGALNIRNILYIQDELAVLETKIKELDNTLGFDSRREDVDPEQKRYMDDARKLLKDYSTISYASVMKLKEAEKRQQRSVYVQLQHKHPILADEMEYITEKKDLVCLTPEEKGSLYRFLQSGESWVLTLFRRSDHITVYSSSWIEWPIRIVCALIGWTYLLAPIGLLYVIEGNFRQLGIVMAFATALSLILAAAYAAVLVGFVGTP